MSVTTTANPATQSMLQLLTDYELTHSASNEDDDTTTTTAAVEAPNPRSIESETHENPDWWTTDYNGVPNYRPINYNLDRDSRPWAGNPGIETAFVWTMLNGVGVVAYISKVWRRTGGRINDQIFKYSIGGER